MRSVWYALFCFMWLPFGALASAVERGEAAGLTFWLIEDRNVPVIEVNLYFKDAGYISDAEAQQGRAALAGSLLLEGAGERDAKSFNRALEEKAIQLSVNVGRDGVSISMKTLAEHRDAAFALLSDMLLMPRFDALSIAKVKRQMSVARQRKKESPSYLAGRAYVAAAYPDHPYAQSRLGSDESVDGLSQADLQAYHQAYFAKSNAILSFAGALSQAEAKRLVDQFMGALPVRARPERRIDAAANAQHPFVREVQKALPQRFLLFAREGVSRDDSGFYAAYLLNHIIGGGALTSRLGVEVRKKRGLSYGIYTSLQQSEYATRWSGSVSTQAETAQEAKRVIEQTLKDVAQNGVSAEELRAAKDYVKGSFPLKLDSNRGVLNYLFAMQLFDLGQDYLDQRNAYFEAVSLEQVNAVAREWLSPDSWSWVEVGPHVGTE